MRSVGITMSKKAFLRKLALERAQYHLAQICAVISVASCSDHADGLIQAEGPAEGDWESLRLLIENLGRDLAYIDTVTDMD